METHVLTRSHEYGGDIEDLASTTGGGEEIGGRQEIGSRVVPRRLSKGMRDRASVKEASSWVPGTEKIWVKTYGCSHNTSDAEFMMGQLHEYGYTLLSDAESEDADLWLINSCTVKGPSQSAVGNLLKKARDMDIAVVVSGCVPQGQKDAKELEGVSTLGVT